MNRIKELQDFIGSQQSEITEFDENLIRKLIQQITVYDDRFTVRLKSGLEINIEASNGSSPLNPISSEEPYPFLLTIVSLPPLPSALFLQKQFCHQS